MATIIILLGPQAVGKMTISQRLSEITGFGALINHHLIDLCSTVYPYGSTDSEELRLRLTKTIVNDSIDLNKSIIITRTFDFSSCYSIKEFMYLQSISKSIFIELTASLTTRLKRNKTENRLKHKPSKRNTLLSEKRIIKTNKEFIYSPPNNLLNKDNYHKINNDYLSVDETCEIIVSKIRPYLHIT